MEINSKNNHEQNQKKEDTYINKLETLNDNEDDIKMVIEDSLENQEKEYEKNRLKKENKREMSLVPLFIVLVLGFNLIIYFNCSDDNLFIPFISIAISFYLLFKYIPKKAKEKLVKEFEETFEKLINFLLFFNNNRENKFKKYISVSSEDTNQLLKDEEKVENTMESPLLNI